LKRLTQSELVKQQDVFRWFIYLLRNRYARQQAWQWMTENWHWIEKTYKGDKSFDDFARYSASVFATKEWLETYRAFFTPLRDQTVLQRAIDVGLTEIQSRVEWLDRDRESVLTILAQETQ
jgi:aminopeptidase N